MLYQNPSNLEGVFSLQKKSDNLLYLLADCLELILVLRSYYLKRPGEEDLQGILFFYLIENALLFEDLLYLLFVAHYNHD